MPQSTITRVNGQLGVFSWTEGFRKTTAPTPKSEEDILRMLLRLEKLGKDDEADRLLQLYCR